MNEPDLDKIRRAAELAMEHAVRSEEHLSWLYCGWIRHHCRELLYEDLWRATEPEP